MKLIEQYLVAGCGAAPSRAEAWLAPLQRACDEAEIDTRLRVAAFLATVGAESQHLTSIVDHLDYGPERLIREFPHHFGPQNAVDYAYHSERIADRVYGGRFGNGNEGSGDGWRYRGRGLIRIIGRTLYRRAGAALGLPLEQHPELLEETEHAARAAGWYWGIRRINGLADRGNIGAVTHAARGSTATLPLRHALYHAALQVLPAV